MRVLYGLGRAIFGGFFLYNGINHFRNHDALAGYAQAKNMPYPHEAVSGSAYLLALSGASLVFGIKPRMGALGVAAFLAGSAGVFHDFWNQEEGQQKQNEMIHFSKNIAMLGAALAFAGDSRSRQSCETCDDCDN